MPCLRGEQDCRQPAFATRWRRGNLSEHQHKQLQRHREEREWARSREDQTMAAAIVT